MNGFIKYIKLEAKSSNELENLINEKAQELNLVSIYGMNGRHYAWFSVPKGSVKKIVKSRTTMISDSKKTKVNL